MSRIQLIAIGLNFIFLMYTSRLIIRGRLREEYAVVWWICAGLLLLFSIWTEGLDVMAHLVGVYLPTNLVFATLIFIILMYLLHLSISNSKLQAHITRLTQELSIMKEKMEAQGKEPSPELTKTDYEHEGQ